MGTYPTRSNVLLCRFLVFLVMVYNRFGAFGFWESWDPLCALGLAGGLKLILQS